MKERANKTLRFLDRYLGICLLLFLIPFKRRHRKMPQNIREIAFLKLAGIGDTVLLSALVTDFQKAYPQARITLFTGHANHEAALLILHTQVKALSVFSPFKALFLLRRERYDLWIDFDPWPRINALFSFFSRSAFTIGFKTKNQFRHFLYDQIVLHSIACHEIENYRSCARAIGVPTLSSPKIEVPFKPKLNCTTALHMLGAGSRAYLKEWPEKNWKELILFLQKRGKKVVLTGSKKDAPYLQKFVQKGVENWAGKLSLQETAELLTQIDCLVSIDTGIMHLAAALDCFVLALHGPTSPHRWGAIGKNVRVCMPNKVYKPCIELGFEKRCKHNWCMEALSFEEVAYKLEQILEKEHK